MFWKNTAWSWDDAAGNDDDDGGFLLSADCRRTPDSDMDPTCINSTSTVTTTYQSNGINSFSTGPKAWTHHSRATSRPLSLDSANANYYTSPLYANNQCQDNQDSSPQRLVVST